MKYSLAVLAFIVSFSFQSSAQKSSHETSTYEVYSWALANIKDLSRLEYTQNAPWEPTFNEHYSVDTIVTFHPVTFDSIVNIIEHLPSTPKKYAKEMMKYVKDKQRWAEETQEGQQKLVYIEGAEYRPYTPSSEFQTIFNEVKIDLNKGRPQNIKPTKLLTPKGRNHKYSILSPKKPSPNFPERKLGFSTVFFNACYTVAIFTLEMTVDNLGMKKSFSTLLLTKKDNGWELATVLSQKGN